MRKQYDFSESKSNPYASKLKKQITIRLEPSTIDYFKDLSKELDIPYQNLINHYLRECALSGRRPSMKWSKKT